MSTTQQASAPAEVKKDAPAPVATTTSTTAPERPQSAVGGGTGASTAATKPPETVKEKKDDLDDDYDLDFEDDEDEKKDKAKAPVAASKPLTEAAKKDQPVTVASAAKTEEQKKQEEEVAKKKAADEELAKKKKTDEEAAAKKKADDEAAKKKADDEAAKKKKDDEEAAKKKADEEAAKKKKADDEAASKKKADEEAAQKIKADEEAATKKKAADEAVQKKIEEDAAKKKAEDEQAAKQKAEAEAVNKKLADEASKKKADEEASKKKADEDAAKKKADEDAAKKKAADDETAKKKKADEEAAKKKEIDDQKQKAEEEAKKKSADVLEAKKKADETEAAKKKAEEEASKKKIADDEAAKKKAEDELKSKKAQDELAQKKSEDEAAIKKVSDEKAINKKPEEPAPIKEESKDSKQPEQQAQIVEQSKKERDQENKAEAVDAIHAALDLKKVDESAKKAEELAPKKEEQKQSPVPPKDSSRSDIDLKLKQPKLPVPIQHISPINRYSIPVDGQQKLYNHWKENMRLFKKFNMEKFLSSVKTGQESKAFVIQVKSSGNNLLPAELAAKQVKICGYYTLCHPICGLFGRTAHQTSDACNGKDAKVDHLIVFHSKQDLAEVRIIIQLTYQVFEKNQDGQMTSVQSAQLGTLVSKICSLEGASVGKQEVPLYDCSPRFFMTFKKDQSIEQKLTSQLTSQNKTLNVSVNEVAKSPQEFNVIVPDNCLVNPVQENIPGAPNLAVCIAQENVHSFERAQFAKLSKVFAHNMTIKNINKVDQIVQKYIKRVVDVGNSGYKGNIVGRKLVFEASNSCSILSDPYASMTKDFKAKEVGKGQVQIFLDNKMMKVENIPAVDKRTCLIFKVIYTIKYVKPGFTQIEKDYILGKAPFFLTYMESSLQDKLIEFDLEPSQELAKMNEALWKIDASKFNEYDMTIRLKMSLSESDDIQEELKKQQEQEYQFLLAQELKQRMRADEEKKIKQQEEEEKARLELIRLQEQAKKEAEEEERKRKEQEDLKNQQEIKDKAPTPPKPQQQKEDQEADTGRILDSVLEHKDPEVQAMIDQLKTLLSKSKDDQHMYKDTIKKLRAAIERLMNQQPTAFGTTGAFNALMFSDFNEKDLDRIQKDNKRLEFDETDANFRPSLEEEIQDSFKMSTIQIKFVAFKTPPVSNKSVLLPKRMKFSTKFYAFKEIETEYALLRLPKAVAKNLKQQEVIENLNQKQMLPDEQYYLMRYQGISLEEISRKKDPIEIEYEGMTNDLQLNFDFDPATFTHEDSPLEEQRTHEHFCRYLRTKSLIIDVWDGDSQMHFGQCKIPLYLIMRQGSSSKVIGQQFDILESVNAERVGGLQLVITNTGRTQSNSPQKKLNDLMKTPGSSLKKIVNSVPIETQEIQESLQEKVLREQQLANQNLSLNEDERKRKRIERLKKMNLTNNLDSQKLINAQSTDWEKMEQLKQIKILREINKQNIINKVAKDSTISNQKTVNVISGEVQLFELEVKNPYSQKSTFTIKIDDDELKEAIIMVPELRVVDNGNKQWEHWYNQGKCSKPKDWNCVTANGRQLALDPNQETNILLRFQSFREPVIGLHKALSDQEKATMLRQRSIRVQILDNQNIPIQEVQVNVEPRELICDQVFRFYEEKKTKSRSMIPNFISLVDDIPLNLCHLRSSGSINFETAGEHNICAITQNGEANTVQRGYLFIYQDPNCANLLGACKVEVYSLNLLRMKIKSGEEYEHVLPVLNKPLKDGTHKVRLVEVFSTDPSLIFAPGGKSRILFQLKDIKKHIQNIPITIMSKQTGIHRARVNCVDIDLKEVLDTFIFEINALDPEIDQNIEVEVKQGTLKDYNLPFKNPFEEEMNFSITSSNINLVQPSIDQLKLKSSETKDIVLKIQKLEAGDHTLFIHINSQQENKNEEEDNSFTQSIKFKLLVK